MSSRLLDQALSQSGRPDRRQQQSSGADSRNSPYSVRNSNHITTQDKAFKPKTAAIGPLADGLAG